MANLKLTKFQRVAEAPIFIRKGFLNGKCVAFGLPGDLLSVLSVVGEKIDFDVESERILEKVKENAHKNKFFEYRENQFVEVSDPKWFRWM